jgi:CRP-like cAMP-binding protein
MLNEVPLRSARDRFLALRSLEAMAPIGEHSMGLLAEHASYSYYNKGDCLHREADPIEHIHLVLSGAVEVTRLGKRVTIIEGTGGVGILSVLGRDPHGIGAVALEDTVTLRVPVSVLLETYEEEFAFVRNSLRLSAGGLVRQRGALPVAKDAQREEPVVGEWSDTPWSLAEAIIHFQKNGVFSQANLDAVIELTRQMVEVRAEAGTQLFEVGEPSKFSMRIRYGLVRCTSAEGDSVVVGSEFVLGVMDSLADQPRSYSAVTETPFIGYRTDREAFLAVLESHHQMAMRLQSFMAQELLKGN